MSLKWQCEWNEEGQYYDLTKGVKVPVRLFLSPKLFEECEEEVFRQVQNATEFPGVTDVVITPDVHTGYVVGSSMRSSRRAALSATASAN